MNSLFQDLRYGLRMLRRSPGFTLMVVLTLALGIGANTAVFSLVDAVLLRPLPFPDSERLMAAGMVHEGEQARSGALGNADFLAWREQQQSFAHVAAWSAGSSGYSYSGGAEPQLVRGVAVTAEFFDALGVQPFLGRAFQSQDEPGGAPPVVVVSQGFWESHLNADPQAVGRSILLNGTAYVVVGVMPNGLRLPSDEPLDVWPLLRIPTPRGRPPYYLRAFGRLKPGVSPQQAAAELTAASRTVEQQFPGGAPPKVGRVVPLRTLLTARVQTMLWVLLATVVLVLFIAIVNVANLLLARAATREKEMGVRLALGATRSRILRQLVTESVLLAGIGGGLGVLLAGWAQQAFLAVSSLRIPLSYQVQLDTRVLAFTAVISVASGVLFGLAPALHGFRGSLHDTLRDAARSTSGVLGQATRRVLVASEFALALVLLIGAALMVRSLLHLQDVDPGFRTDGLLTAQITLPTALYPDESTVVAFWDELLRRLNAVPGVESASLTLSLPPHLLYLTNPFTVEGQSYDNTRPQPLAEEMTIGEGYFRTLGIPILAGSEFTEHERQRAETVIIINRALAEQYFPGQDPIGRRLQTGDPDPRSPWETIVGVVGDVKYSGLDAPAVPQLYKLYATPGWTGFSRSMYLVIRTGGGDPLSVAPAVRQQLTQLDRNLPLARVASMQQLLGDSVQEQRFRTLLLGSFAGFALLLACFGVYAVMSYAVTQRTRELGIRMALGASRGQVLHLVLRQALVLCGVGMGVGLAAALVFTRTMRSLLFAVTPNDPLSFVATALLLSAVALLASYIPARRAAKVDPMVALRYE